MILEAYKRLAMGEKMPIAIPEPTLGIQRGALKPSVSNTSGATAEGSTQFVSQALSIHLGSSREADEIPASVSEVPLGEHLSDDVPLSEEDRLVTRSQAVGSVMNSMMTGRVAELQPNPEVKFELDWEK